MRVQLSYAAGMDERIMMIASCTSQMVDAHSLEYSMTDSMPGEVAMESERRDSIRPPPPLFAEVRGRSRGRATASSKRKDKGLAERVRGAVLRTTSKDPRLTATRQMERQRRIEDITATCLKVKYDLE